MSQTDWRNISADDRLDFINEVQNRLTLRQHQGRETYGDTFAGDPLDHAEEELIDCLFYVHMARKRMAAWWDEPQAVPMSQAESALASFRAANPATGPMDRLVANTYRQKLARMAREVEVHYPGAQAALTQALNRVTAPPQSFVDHAEDQS